MTALTQSPAIDVVGIGFASGEISIYDIRADEKMMRIFVREGPVRALAFRGGKGGSNICSLTRVLFFLQMDIRLLPLPRKRDIYPSGISAPADVCYIRYEVLTTAAYLHCNGSLASHCSLAREMIIVSRFVFKMEEIIYPTDTSTSNGTLIR
jgi:hypothetical protein